jgi:flagellar protein FliS
VQRIIDEFRNTLDFKYPVAKDFDRVYEYLERRLVEANMTKDAEIVEEVVTHLRSMRDTWKEVMKRAKSPAPGGAQ